ncbi:SpoIVB peptidase [Alicyclobacillus fastidiosus]|uniref:SpoIVB peptidase n=1 Tax=Alicyclobacillus fastidiosus TaxID=392011 RepID=A0ABY6ZN95_9BACL|nr:SpoIVB peptidase [Alicyclobacillus fastidiosus]WAH44311.1 SpoIVB peptidase [Alicyclobacillus fastidiosus]GMA60636.1 SpoIVB peptidase [Alicyclobacillus fastidiosus]
MAGRLRTIRFVGLLAITVACFTPAVQKMASTPTQVSMVTGDTVALPMTGTQPSTSSSSIASTYKASSSSCTVTSTGPGDTDISGKRFGIIPWKTHIHVEPAARVMVGGQAVGIRIQSTGPVVVGFRRLTDGSSPCANAHMQLGDRIISVNDRRIETASDLQAALRSRGQAVHMTVVRGNTTKQFTLSFKDASVHQLGLYVRDRTVGVGTLTFYDPAHHTFGALGHIITDADTGQPVVGAGGLYQASITGLQPGAAGAPGEKRGTFSSASTPLGHIDVNTPYGVFGSMSRPPVRTPVPGILDVALPEQVHEGPAKMYTVVHGTRVEGFDVRIDNVARQSNPATKSMIVRVTDPRLLSETGGIIQGMSGSPLVQDHRLIGAVTHVFVSDPTRGYAVYAMWMFRQTRLSGKQQTPSTVSFLHPRRYAV